MKPSVKIQWINALRNDPAYVQDPNGGKLKTPHGYCCLGVLCDLYLKETNQEWGKDSIAGFDRYFIEQAYNFLPESVQDWAGISEESPEVTLYDEKGCAYSESLAGLNDEGRNFSALADLIEAQF